MAKKSKIKKAATSSASITKAPPNVDINLAMSTLTITTVANPVTTVQNSSMLRKQVRSKRIKNVVEAWNDYFGSHDKLANWQKLCEDLRLDISGLGSITKCKQALKTIWINIHDFLNYKNGKGPLVFFNSRRELANYTISNNLFYPKKKAKEGGPVKALLAHILN